MSRLTISIAMCTYNGEKYLQEQLDSIVNQSRLPNELIVCDDNSSDQSISILERFSVLAPFSVRIFKNQANMGSTKNFEKAITLCEGDIIALSDQDDVWHDDKLKLIEEVFNSSKQVGAVFSNGNIVSEDLSSLGHTLWDTYDFREKNRIKFLNGKAFELILNHNVITGATLAFRSSFRNKILPISPLWVHDSWIAFLFSIISSIKFIDKTVIEYRQHKNQQIGGIEKKFTEQIALSHSVTDYSVQIQQYKRIIEHISKYKLDSKSSFVPKISEKIEHLSNRQKIYQLNLFVRMIKSFIELIRLRYHSYSGGYKSFIKDIFTVYK